MDSKKIDFSLGILIKVILKTLYHDICNRLYLGKIFEYNVKYNHDIYVQIRDVRKTATLNFFSESKFGRKPKLSFLPTL